MIYYHGYVLQVFKQTENMRLYLKLNLFILLHTHDGLNPEA